MLHVLNNLTSRELFFQLGQDSHSGGGSNFSVQFQVGYFSSAVIKSLLLSDSPITRYIPNTNESLKRT